jgi:hypothetical protein
VTIFIQLIKIKGASFTQKTQPNCAIAKDFLEQSINTESTLIEQLLTTLV